MKNGKLAGFMKVAVFLLAVFCLVGFYVYFFYWVKRPMYALDMACSAVREKNPVKFEQYVDLDSVYGKAYDEYALILANQVDVANPKKKLPKKLTSAFTVTLLKGFKGEVVSSVKNLTLNNIAERNGTDGHKGHDPSDYGMKRLFLQLVDAVCEENDLKNLNADRIEVEEFPNGIAQGSVRFVGRDKEKDEPLTVRFRMDYVKDTGWKVTEITNVAEIVSRIKKNPVSLDDLF